eukprot:2528930-Prymnesium_polylepis.1
MDHIYTTPCLLRCWRQRTLISTLGVGVQRRAHSTHATAPLRDACRMSGGGRVHVRRSGDTAPASAERHAILVAGLCSPIPPLISGPAHFDRGYLHRCPAHNLTSSRPQHAPWGVAGAWPDAAGVFSRAVAS